MLSHNMASMYSYNNDHSALLHADNVTAEKSSERAQIGLACTAYLLVCGSERPMRVDRYKV